MTPMTSRKLGLTAAPHRRPDRGLAVRAGVPGARRLSAPAPARPRPGLPRARIRGPDDPSGGVGLPAWWIPARDGAPGPAVLLVHGWESSRDRTLPNAQILNAIGMHVLTLDVRGHGANPAEELPLTAGEFGEDALAGVRALLARPDVTAVGILGHSMGAIGALLAAAAEPRVRGVVAASSPADPYRLTRQTFRLAKLPLPGPFAWPLAWLTTHVFLTPRGHTVRGVSADGRSRPTRDRCCSSTATPTGSSRSATSGRSFARSRPRARTSRMRAPSRSSSSPAASTAGCTSSAPIAPPWAGSSRRRSVGRSSRPRPRGSREPRRRLACPSASTRSRRSRRNRVASGPSSRAIRNAGGHPAGRRRRARRPRMTDVWTAIRAKRMVRRFAARPLDPDHLTRIVDAGRHAGSSKNKQRWDFVVVEDRARLQALAKVGPFAEHVGGAAAAIALITPDPTVPGASLSLVWDAGLAAENMMLAAWELGVGSCPATVYDQSIARAVLAIPDDRWCGYVLSFGYPADPEDMTRAAKAGGRARTPSTGALGTHAAAGSRLAYAPSRAYCPAEVAGRYRETDDEPAAEDREATGSGAKAAPLTITWRSASPR